MNELHLFAGAGGGILAGQMLGHRCVCAVEWEPYAQAVLMARQNDGSLPAFPIWDDVQTFDGRPWRGIVDIVAGGFPCQDISVAGKGAGIDGARSGMWGHMARIVGEVRPRYVFVENSPALITRGLGRVLSDLAALGYDCRWTVLGAADVGAPHQRDRFWLVAAYAANDSRIDGEGRADIPARHRKGGRADVASSAGCGRAEMAHAMRQRPSPQWNEAGEQGGFGKCGEVADATSQRQQAARHTEQYGQTDGYWETSRARGNGEVGDSHCSRLQEQRGGITNGAQLASFECPNWWQSEPELGRVAHGVARRVDRLKAIGNGQVPLCAATAWRLLNDE